MAVFVSAVATLLALIVLALGLQADLCSVPYDSVVQTLAISLGWIVLVLIAEFDAGVVVCLLVVPVLSVLDLLGCSSLALPIV